MIADHFRNRTPMSMAASDPSGTTRTRHIMNPFIFSALALAITMLVSACASHTPAPVPATDSTTGTQEVHTY